MKKFVATVALFGLLVCFIGPVHSAEEYGDYYGRGHHHMMGPEHGMYVGRGGMHGGGRGMGPSSRGWESMKPEEQEKWKKMRSSYLQDTLELRKELAAKQVELDTLWNQPDVDQKKVEKLSEEIANIRAELWKKQDKYLMSCRKEFGDQGWACPGMGQW